MVCCFPPFIGPANRVDGRPRSVGGVSVMVLSLERFLESNEIITARLNVDSFGFVVVDSYEYLLRVPFWPIKEGPNRWEINDLTL